MFRETNSNLQSEGILCCCRRHYFQIFVAFIEEAKQYIEEGKQAKQNKRTIVSNYFHRSIRLLPYDFASTYTTPITPPPQPLSRTSAGVVAVIYQGSWIARSKKAKQTKRKISLELFSFDLINSVRFCFYLHNTHHTTTTAIVACKCWRRCFYLSRKLNNKRQRGKRQRGKKGKRRKKERYR